MLFTDESFGYLPYGGLSKTLKTFHIDKMLKSGTDVFFRKDGNLVTVNGYLQGSTIERTFEKLRTGHRPVNLGSIQTEYAEFDPIFGEVSLSYRMDASKVSFTNAAKQDLRNFEKRFNRQMRTGMDLNLFRLLGELLEKNKKSEGNARITLNTRNAASTLMRELDWGAQFLLEPDVGLSLFLPFFDDSPDLVFQASFEINPNSLIFTLRGSDNEGFQQYTHYLFAQTPRGLAPIKIQQSLTWHNLSASMQIALRSGRSYGDLGYYYYNFGNNYALAAALWQHRYHEKAVEISDGTLQGMVRVINDETYIPISVFFANLVDPVEGRTELKFVPDPSTNDRRLVPDFIHYNHVIYAVKVTPTRQVVLIDRDQNRYFGSYRLEVKTDYEVGEIPVVTIRVKGLP